ncbi:hypothetical protein RND81_05G112600 [Saponaria officinalis]|uniref:3'-5' exonuclease domain-containing protein n=1 Tax=Saponaria officinalis TaxID=3572 RepID=A0AAW1KY00_SAPOF
MGVIIRETPQRNFQKTRHFTVNLNGNHGVHTISTTLTTHPGTVRDWLYSVLYSHRPHLHRLVIGLGVQWTPYYHHYRHSSAATLQLCVGRRCLIYHLHHSRSSPRILHRILSDRRFTFVGLWNSRDAEFLRDSVHRLEMEDGMPVDLRRHVVDDDGRSMKGESIAEIAAEVIGVDIERIEEVVRSDWEVEELSVEQVKHAAVDAFVAYVVAMRIRAWELNPFILG